MGISEEGTIPFSWKSLIMPGSPKVAIVTNSLSGGGAEISMMRVFKSLKENSINATYCAINLGNGADVILSGDVHVVGREWGAGLLGTIGNLLRFRKFLAAHKFDVVIVNCELPELYVALVCPVSTRIIVVEHTSRPWVGRRGLGAFVRSLLVIRGTLWVTVSSNQSKVWPFGQNAVWIANPHVIGSESKPKRKSDLVFVGRLNTGKRPELAARAAQVTDSTINFFGDGPLMEELRRDYESEKCAFYGFVNDPWGVIGEESMLIVTSEYEGDGMNIVEAVLKGNPILLADNNDLRRFNFPSHIYFKDFDELVEKIDTFKNLNHINYIVDNEIKERLQQERDLSSITQKWISILTERTDN